MTKVGFFPKPKTKGTQYVDYILEAIQKSNPDLVIEELPRFREIIKGKVPDIVYLNWFENIPGSDSEFFKLLAMKYISIGLLKAKGTKIISVFHNKQPHESKHYPLNNHFFRYQLKNSDYIVVLNEESKKYVRKYIGNKKDHKIKIIPHPLFPLPKKEFPQKPKPFNVLFFGLLRSYKNIELIFEIANNLPDIQFTIAGQPINSQYGEELKKLSTNLPNVNLELGFQTEEKIGNLINEASIILLPYNQSSSLNSGVVHHAFSRGINVIIPTIATTTEYKNKDLIYTYDYTTPEDHKEKLEKILKKAWQDYINDYPNFVDKTQKLYQEEMENHSIEKISQIIKDSGIF